MKLWLLERNDVGYDQTTSCVVCAKTEEKARELADADFSDESSWTREHRDWLNLEKSTCVEVKLKKEMVIHSHFLNG
jgi:hypothetical protein